MPRDTQPKEKTLEKEEKRTRTVRILGREVEVRKITPSKEALRSLTDRQKKRDFIGHMPVNPPRIEQLVSKEKTKILRNMALMNGPEREDFIRKGPIDLMPHNNLHKYFITCTSCGEKVAYVWARNEKLEGWCDLHYLCWYDKDSWYGSMTVNVSPVDGELGFECACGEDTREYRSNRTLPPIPKALMSEYSLKHRKFAHPDSKFSTMEVQ